MSRSIFSLSALCLLALSACKGGDGNDGSDTGNAALFGDARLDAGEGESTDVQLCMSGDRIIAAWVDDRGGTTDIWVSTSDDLGSTWLSEPVNASDSPGEAHSPTLACSSSDAWLAWEDTRGDKLGNDAIWVSRSSNGGATWGGPIVLRADAEVAHDANSPHLSASGADVMVVWAANPGGGYDIYSSVSHDGGVAFGSPTRVESDTAGASFSAKPQGALLDSGAARVIWEDRRTGIMTIRGARSSDGGDSFGSDDAISDDSAGDAFNASLAVDGDAAWVAWHQGPIGDRLDVYASWASAGGAGFVSSFRVSGGDVGERDDLRPKVAAHDGVGAIGWFSEGGGGYHIFARTYVNGTSISEPFRVDGAEDAGRAERPAIAASTGTIAVAWEDDRNSTGSTSDLYVATTRDSGTSWQGDDRVSGAPRGTMLQVDAAIVADADNAYIAWLDDRNGTSDVYFAAHAIAEAPILDTGATR